MRILAIVQSTHQGNTRKVAEAMADVVPMTITDAEHAARYDFHDYDIVGFGSGIYYGKHDEKLIKLVSSLDNQSAYVFVFSTSGSKGFEKNNKPLIDLLEKRNKVVLGSFGCTGHDKFWMFKLIGGLNKGHPDDQDLRNVREWIADIAAKYEKREE